MILHSHTRNLTYLYSISPVNNENAIKKPHPQQYLLKEVKKVFSPWSSFGDVIEFVLIISMHSVTYLFGHLHHRPAMSSVHVNLTDALLEHMVHLIYN